jgi:large subunit ribosomal protein L29
MKAEEYRQMTPEDLKKEIDALSKSLFDLRFKKVTETVENPAEFRKLRRTLARVRTILRQKERAAAPAPAPAPAKEAEAP